MPIPTVWTERESSGIGWTDCTWCSILMVVDGSGNTKWPLGHHTEAERKAFRAGDPRLNFAGGVEHAQTRYGVTVQSPTPYTQAGLRTALAVPSRVYAVAGKLSNFAAGHRLRRWAPTFTGFHAVAIATLGGGACRWLDPLAPMGFVGEPATIAEIADVFAMGNYPNDARYMAQSVGEDMAVVYIAPFAPRQVGIAAGATVQGWNATTLVKSQTFPAATSFRVDAEVVIDQTPNKPPEGKFWRGLDGIYAGLYVPQPQVSIAPAPPDPVTAAYNEGVAAAAKKATEARKP